jgi:deazaflavin-dependent oxidoreductase (nitroreductase family)
LGRNIQKATTTGWSFCDLGEPVADYHGRMAESIDNRLQRVASARSLLLTHLGRKSGKAHQVRIWFVVDGGRFFIGTANIDRHWVRNVQKTPQVKLAIGGAAFEGYARFLTDPAELEHAMTCMRAKYWPFYPILKLGDWLIRAGLIRMQNGAFEVTLRRD